MDNRFEMGLRQSLEPPEVRASVVKLPALIVAADWSVNEDKRWFVRATLREDYYVISAPEPVGEISSLVERLEAAVDDGESVLLGFDFPIGLPAEYARSTGVRSFREALREFGSGEWLHFYDRSNHPSLHQPFFPLPTQDKGEYRRGLADRLGVDNLSRLLRKCDFKRSTRKAAECMFFTLGAAQVGAGTIVGWRDVLQPNQDRLRLWPFDGDLATLLNGPGITVAEIYPAEAYTHLQLQLDGSKALRPNRREAVAHWLAGGLAKNVRITHPAESWIRWGFLSDDDFDAMVGALSMIDVVSERRPHVTPMDDEVNDLEGWILGQDPSFGTEQQLEPRIPTLLPTAPPASALALRRTKVEASVYVTPAVVAQVRRAGINQSQIALWNISSGNARHRVIVSLSAAGRTYNLVVGDSHAAWRSHQTTYTISDFDELFEYLARSPGMRLPVIQT
jgi:hypothetical protein